MTQLFKQFGAAVLLDPIWTTTGTRGAKRRSSTFGPLLDLIVDNLECMRFNDDNDLIRTQDPIQQDQESLVEYLCVQQQENKRTLLNLLAILAGDEISHHVRQFLQNHRPAPGAAVVRGGDFED
jgi:hypothetical protein